MKVLHVISSINENHGGPTRAILGMVLALRQLGIDAEIVTTGDNGDVSITTQGASTDTPVPITLFPRFPMPVKSLDDFAFSPRFTCWLWNHMGQYDLLHVHAVFGYPSTISMRIAQFKKIPYICRPCGLLGRWALSQQETKKSIYLALCERQNLDNAAAIHYATGVERDDAAYLHIEAPSFVSAIGTDVENKCIDSLSRLPEITGLPHDVPIILFMSRLHPVKGLEVLIHALAQITDIPFTFIVAGSGDPVYEQRIRSLITKTGLANRTRFIGFVSGDPKKLLLHEADLFVLTSLSESFGIAVLEALAAGTPVLVTSGVALASTVRQHRLGYVTDMDIAEVAATLRRFLNEREIARRMGERGREYVRKHYSWSHVASNLVQVYQSVLNEQPLPNFNEA